MTFDFFYGMVKFVSQLLWQYWKNLAWHLQICNSCFIRRANCGPWASCFESLWILVGDDGQGAVFLSNLHLFLLDIFHRISKNSHC